MGKNFAPEAPAGYQKVRDWAEAHMVSEENARHWVYIGKLDAISVLCENRPFYYIKIGTPVPRRKKQFDSKNRPLCDNRECFLNSFERCEGLEECMYKDGRCPFFRDKSYSPKKGKATMYKVIYNSSRAPAELKAEALEWLSDHNMSGDIR